MATSIAINRMIQWLTLHLPILISISRASAHFSLLMFYMGVRLIKDEMKANFYRAILEITRAILMSVLITAKFCQLTIIALFVDGHKSPFGHF